MRLLTRLCCVLFVALLPLLSTPYTPTASAASNFTVNSLADTPDANAADGLCADSGGGCTLRAAIQQANADPSGDVIGFSVTGTINLTAALPDISKSMTINGPGASQLTVRRSASAAYRIFVIGAAAIVSVSGLTVSNGLAPLPVNGGPPQEGGGIYNAGSLTLTNVTVSGNRTSDSPATATPVTPSGGGGIYNKGTLAMTDCNVSENSAGSALAGTGLSGGSGGGIYNAGALFMTGSTVNNNHAGSGGDGAIAGGSGGSGGGIYSVPEAFVFTSSLFRCDVSENTSGNGGRANFNGTDTANGNGGYGGGIYNASSMSLKSTVISGNRTGRGASAVAGANRTAGRGGKGGGVYNTAASSGFRLNAVNCVIRDNVTGAGGVGSGTLQSQGDGGDGGGVATESLGEAFMTDCTVVSNQTGLAGDGGGRDGVGGGIYGTMNVSSSVVALNFVRFPSNLSDVAGGDFKSGGYNYLGYFGSACCFRFNDRGGAGSSTSPFIKLDPNTLLPLPGSPLIDAGRAFDVAAADVTAEDIRGAVRPFDFPDIAPQQPAGDNSDIGALERQATDPVPSPTPTPTTVQFGALGGSTGEGCAAADFLTIKRTGATDGTTVVTYIVTDFVNEFGDESAHQRGDFTYTKGQVTFAPGEDSKTFPVLISEDAYHEEPELFIVRIVGVEGGNLGAQSSLTIVIQDNDDVDGTANPIDDNATFVCQHYHDFLSRHADAGGQAFWTARLDECGGDPACLDRRRVDVSAAFFLSIEFQNTGYFVIRANKVGLGDHPNNPDYITFLGETQDVARGVVVGQPGFEAVLEANKQRYAETFVQRAVFQTAHGSQTAAQFVDSLFANVGVTPTTQERDAAISAFGAGGTAGQTAALRSVVESGSVYNKLYNESFVLMQYFGYLRRNPNDPPDNNLVGYNFWLGKLNEATLPGEDARDEAVAIRRIRRAEMVRSFLLSTEYRGRFAGDPSRGNP